MPINILLADDHTMVRQGLRSLLEARGFHVSGEASDGVEAVRLAHQLLPDVVILDFAMPLMNGLTAAGKIQQTCPTTAIIILSMHAEQQYVVEALRNGVSGYVLKSCAADELSMAVREVFMGNTYLSPVISGLMVDALLSPGTPESEVLTTREREVLQLVAEGNTSKEVAVHLGISEKTAESHRTRIMQKVHAHNTSGLVRYAIRTGIIHPALFLFLSCAEQIESVADMVSRCSDLCV